MILMRIRPGPFEGVAVAARLTASVMICGRKASYDCQMGADDKWGAYPDRFCRELGRFAFVFADLEGVAGELIVVHARHPVELRGDWSRSGAQLLKALRECFTRDDFQKLCDDLEKLSKTRNLFMHGEWIFHSETSAMVLKRHHDKLNNSPTYQHAPKITPDDISQCTHALLKIEHALGEYLLEKMALRHEPG